MKLDTVQAKKIIDLMPSDTVVWNCWSAEDMIDAAADVDDVEALVGVLCALGERDIEGRLAAQEGEKLDRMIEESEQWKTRLRTCARKAIEIGLVV